MKRPNTTSDIPTYPEKICERVVHLERRLATAEGLLKLTQCWFAQYPEELQEGIIAFLQGEEA